MKEFKKEKITLIHGDSFEYIKTLPDNAYDLLIADPPYGIKRSNQVGKSKRYDHKGNKIIDKKWDENPISKEFFIELFRVSKNQVIFGANHFIDQLPEPRNTQSWLLWDKREDLIPERSYADGELAWTSFNKPLRIYRFYFDGFLQRIKQKRIHPTEKAINLYKWIIGKYTDGNVTVLDPFGGSMSSAIAFYELGLEATIIELDEEYYDKAVRRFDEITSQIKMF